MENSYFILSDRSEVRIERFHICTWDLKKDNAFVEFGVELCNSSALKSIDKIDFYLSIPFLDENCEVTCLSKNLLNSENSKFIFNDTISRTENINGADQEDGVSVIFANRGGLSIIPIEHKEDLENKIIVFSLKVPKNNLYNLYTRILVKTNYRTLAINNKEITKSVYTYDIKLNEQRNLPLDINKVKRQNKLNFCEVSSCFCFHIYPNDYSISFVNEKKLKNIRKLEVSAFKQYLPNIKSLNDDRYLILFNKSESSSSYTFYTVFAKEIIGYKQILMAVGANILCSLLFAEASIRQLTNFQEPYICRIPWEYWASLGILATLVILLFLPDKIRYHKLK